MRIDFFFFTDTKGSINNGSRKEVSTTDHGWKVKPTNPNPKQAAVVKGVAASMWAAVLVGRWMAAEGWLVVARCELCGGGKTNMQRTRNSKGTRH